MAFLGSWAIWIRFSSLAVPLILARAGFDFRLSVCWYVLLAIFRWLSPEGW
jgi:hypothetical protein